MQITFWKIGNIRARATKLTVRTYMCSKVARGNKTSRQEYKSERFVWFLSASERIGHRGSAEAGECEEETLPPTWSTVCMRMNERRPEALTSLASRARVRAGDIARVRIPHALLPFANESTVDRRKTFFTLSLSLCLCLYLSP